MEHCCYWPTAASTATVFVPAPVVGGSDSILTEEARAGWCTRRGVGFEAAAVAVSSLDVDRVFLKSPFISPCQTHGRL